MDENSQFYFKKYLKYKELYENLKNQAGNGWFSSSIKYYLAVLPTTNVNEVEKMIENNNNADEKARKAFYDSYLKTVSGLKNAFSMELDPTIGSNTLKASWSKIGYTLKDFYNNLDESVKDRSLESDDKQNFRFVTLVSGKYQFETLDKANNKDNKLTNLLDKFNAIKNNDKMKDFKIGHDTVEDADKAFLETFVVMVVLRTLLDNINENKEAVNKSMLLKLIDLSLYSVVLIRHGDDNKFKLSKLPK
jgi:hypothetical protein